MIKKKFLKTAVFLFLSKIILHGESHSFNALEYDDLEFPDQEEMFSSIDDLLTYLRVELLGEPLVKQVWMNTVL